MHRYNTPNKQVVDHDEPETKDHDWWYHVYLRVTMHACTSWTCVTCHLPSRHGAHACHVVRRAARQPRLFDGDVVDVARLLGVQEPQPEGLECWDFAPAGGARRRGVCQSGVRMPACGWLICRGADSPCAAAPMPHNHHNLDNVAELHRPYVHESCAQRLCPGRPAPATSPYS